MYNNRITTLDISNSIRNIIGTEETTKFMNNILPEIEPEKISLYSPDDICKLIRHHKDEINLSKHQLILIDEKLHKRNQSLWINKEDNSKKKTWWDTNDEYKVHKWTESIYTE